MCQQGILKLGFWGKVYGYLKTSAYGSLKGQQTGRLAKVPGRGREFKASSHGSNSRSTERSWSGGGAALRGGRGGVEHGNEGKVLASTYSFEVEQPIILYMRK